jgi:hypothetical protein
VTKYRSIDYRLIPTGRKGEISLFKGMKHPAVINHLKLKRELIGGVRRKRWRVHIRNLFGEVRLNESLFCHPHPCRSAPSVGKNRAISGVFGKVEFLRLYRHDVYDTSHHLRPYLDTKHRIP